MWLIITELAKEKQALALTLSLNGRKREVAREVPLAELNSNDGVTKLNDKLKSSFATNDVDLSYEAFVQLECLKRQPDQTISDYLLEFSRRYSKIERLGMKLPDSVVACKMLYNASLSQSERQMVLASCSTLTAEGMKSTLRRVFSEVMNHQHESCSIKAEPAFQTQTEDSNDEDHAFWNAKRMKRSATDTLRYKGNMPNRYKQGSTVGKNPRDRQGNVTTCRICGSRNH